MKMNTAWYRLKNFLKELPNERFDMNSFFNIKDESGHRYSKQEACVLNECGSTGCIAGWTLFLKDPSTKISIGDPERVGILAAEELGIEYKPYGERLFEINDGDWEIDIVMEYGRTPKGAIAMMDRIENEIL